MRILISPSAGDTVVDKLKIQDGGLDSSSATEAITVLNAVPVALFNQPNGIAQLNADGKILSSFIPTDAVGQVAVTGPGSLIVGNTGVYSVTNYDMFTQYTVTPVNGSVYMVKDVIYYTCDNNAGVGGFIINGRTITVTASVAKPATPSITSPVNNGNVLFTSYQITSSTFVQVGDSSTHQSTDWQVSLVPDFSTTILNVVNDTVNKTSYTISGLIDTTVYYVQVRHRASNGNSSNWSNSSTFTIAIPVPAALTFSSPLAGATGVSQTPTITTTAFVTPADDSTHVSSDWQISTVNTFASLVYSASNDTVNKTSWNPGTLTINTQYYARMRVKSSNGKSSDWSVTRNFTIVNNFAFNPVIASDVYNYNLKAAAIAAGWNQVIPLAATVTINSGVVVGAANTSSYAFDTGSSFPAGTTLAIVNNGYISGAGGQGGGGGINNYGNGNDPDGYPGLPGGPGLITYYPIAITNNGVVQGGGGGGGGVTYGGGGGGGAGRNPGISVTVQGNAEYWAYAGTSGTLTTGGTYGSNNIGGAASGVGGNPGQPGETVSYQKLVKSGPPITVQGKPGGAGGNATVGNGNITWVVAGSRLGALG